MEGGFLDAYVWDAASHVIESIDGFLLDPQDDADQWFDLKASPTSGILKQLTTPLWTAKTFDETYNDNRLEALVSLTVKQEEATSSDTGVNMEGDSLDDGCLLHPQDDADQWFDLKASPTSGILKQLTTPLWTAKTFDETYNDNRLEALVSLTVKQEEATSSDTGVNMEGDSLDDGCLLHPQDDADQWFDLKASPTSGILKQLTTPLWTAKTFDETYNDNRLEALVSPPDVTESTSTENIGTSWGNGRTTAGPGQAHKAVPAQPSRVPKRPVPRNKKPTAPTIPPVIKKRSIIPAATARRAFEQRRRSSSKFVRRSGAGVRNRVRLRSKPVVSKTSATVLHTASTSHAAQQKSRLKNHTDGSSTEDHSYKEMNFTSQLRKHPPPLLKFPKGTTIPKPFNLSRSKRKLEETGNYVPMAQQIEQFQKRTPTHYHLQRRQCQERGPSLVKADKLKITHPKSPQLMTRHRHRPTTVKSTAEIEAEELEKLQQFKFKALELNQKILQEAVVPKKLAVKAVTRPEGFQLETEKRLQERQTSKKPEQLEDHTFHSRPVPTRILEEVVGVPEKKMFNLTVPKSPEFALKNRVRIEKKHEEEKPPAPIKALAVPHFLPFQLKPLAKSQVKMCPFSFEERERERRVMKEKKLEELRNKEVPKFKAQPLPDFREVHLPKKKMKEELKRQAEAACFKARPNTIVHKEPFVPKEENRSIFVPQEFQLSTERRANKRQEFDREKSEEEALKAHAEEERAREQEERDKDEVARLRQEHVQKAQPIRRYKPVEVKKRVKMSLTVPQSPNFSDRFRM